MKKEKKQENFDKRWKILMISLIVIFTGMWYSSRKEKIELAFQQQKMEEILNSEKENTKSAEDDIKIEKLSSSENLNENSGQDSSTKTKKEIPSTKININTATIEELMLLPGIGEVISKSIIDYRTESGGFQSIEEIKNVKRIGDKTFEKIKDNIVISDE